MTGRRRGATGIAASAVLAALGGWLAFQTLGGAGVLWCTLGGTAVLAIALRSHWTVTAPNPHILPRDPPGIGQHFGHYEEMAGQVSWAMLQRRSFEYSLRPMLWQLIQDLAADRYPPTQATDDNFLRARLGEQAWALLRPHGRPQEDEAGRRQRGPSAAELRQLVDRMEHL